MRHLITLRPNFIPVHILEKLVIFEIRGVILRPQALLRVLFKQLFQKTRQFRAEILWHGYGLLRNVIEHLRAIMAIVVEVGRCARHHVVEQCAQTPPVDGVRVTLAHDDLGREVLRRAAVAECAITLTDILL